MVRFPPPICSRHVIFFGGNGHRPDKSHFLRPPKLILEGALYSTSPPPKSHHMFCPPPHLWFPKLLSVGMHKLTRSGLNGVSERDFWKTNLPSFEAYNYKSPKPKRRKLLAKRPFLYSKRALLKTHLNWTGSVFSLLISAGQWVVAKLQLEIGCQHPNLPWNVMTHEKVRHASARASWKRDRAWHVFAQPQAPGLSCVWHEAIAKRRASNRIMNTQPKLRTNPVENLRTNRIMNKRVFLIMGALQFAQRVCTLKSPGNLDGGNSALVIGFWSRPIFRSRKHHF